MKIEQIKRIKNYRIFRDFCWTADLSNFSRFNLIYGWNGSGKTTLSYIFTYLQNKCDISEGDVKFLVDSQLVAGSDIAEAVIPQVRVFNRDSVDRNLFEVPNHELAPVYYIGEDSAAKQQQIELLKADEVDLLNKKRNAQVGLSSSKKRLDDFCKSKALEIKGLLSSSGHGEYNNYNKSDFSAKCKKMFEHKVRSYCLLPDVYNECLANKEGVAFNTIDRISASLPDYLGLTTKVRELLKRSILSETISELSENPSIASWVQRGIEIHDTTATEVRCHFCDNKVLPQRIKDLEAHFNDRLTGFQEEIDAEIVVLESASASVERFELPVASQFYPHLQGSFKSGCKNWSTNKYMVKVFLETLIDALQKKREQPFKTIDLNEYLSISGESESEKSVLQKVLGFIGDMAQGISASMGLDAIETINEFIDEHNQYTQNFGEKVKKARRVLEEHIVSMGLGDYQEKKEAVAIAEIELNDLGSQLGALITVLLQLEREIKEFVRPVEELNAEMAAYLGRNELQFTIQGNGYIISRNGHPAMNLSEGEKSGITFMYFLKTLEDSAFDMANGVVVIDDPISSLDANSMYSAFGFMKARTRAAGQLFVLTHSFTFFRHVRKWFYQEPKLPAIPGHQGSSDYRKAARFYMLDTTVDGGARSALIKNIDPLLKDYESEYQYLFKKVHDFVQVAGQEPLENYYGLPNIARRLLESFLTFKMPNFTAHSIDKKLDEINFDTAKKNRILRFLHVHSHYDQVGAPEHDLSLLAEAPAVLSDLIDLIREVDEEHYAGMASFFEGEEP